MTQQIKSKKGQEEMVGFVLIMLVVAIIFLVFLGIYFRGASQTTISEDQNILTFLSAISKFTTDCGPDDSYPIELDDLIIDCDNLALATCPNNGELKCDIVKETMKELIERNWNFNPNSTTKGYELQVLRETSSGEEFVVRFQEGVQRAGKRSAEIPLSGGVIVRLDIYT